MSVINQVLVELDKRHASTAERGVLPDHVRALPDGRGDRRMPWLAAAGIVAGFAVGAAAWFALFYAGRELPRAMVAAPLPVPVERKDMTPVAVAVASDAAPRTGGRSSLDPLPTAGAHQSETAPRAMRTREPIASARVVAQAEVAAPEPEAGPKGATASATPPAEGGMPAPQKVKEPVQPQARPVAEKAVGDGKPGIEKQVRQPSARELSDNEYRKAATSLHQGRTHEAIEGFRAAINLYPGHHGARQALVALLVESKANAEAERLLQDGIKLAPEQIGFAMTLARLQVDRGDGPGAIATLQGSLAQAQASPDYAGFLAALLQRQGRHAEAIEQFQGALRARPAAGVWWLGIAISLQATDRSAEAQEAYRRAKTTNNLNPELTAFADQRLRQLQ